MSRDSPLHVIIVGGGIGGLFAANALIAHGLKVSVYEQAPELGEIHRMGTAILLVEQNVSRALSLVQRAYVLESGNVIMHGTSDELANNKQVQAAYLGI